MEISRAMHRLPWLEPGLEIERPRSTGIANPKTMGTACYTSETMRTGTQPCFYVNHLRSKQLLVDETVDYLLLEHLKAGHSTTPCDPLPASTADEIVLHPMIREELPFEQVHGLVMTDIKRRLRSTQHIRLIALHPPTDIDAHCKSSDSPSHSHLRCDAYQASLQDLTTAGRPLFAAVPYVCGDQTPARRIRCGQKSFCIPENVYNALLGVQFEDRPRLIWLDYLCIRQHDVEEKSHQVGMMHKIYAQAHVISWLGKGSSIDFEALSFYLDLLAILWTLNARSPENRDLSRHELGDVAASECKAYVADIPQDDRPPFSLQLLESVFFNEYFDRIWTVQEIILGKSNTCQIGEAQFSVATLVAASRVVNALHAPKPIRHSSLGYLRIEKMSMLYLRPALIGAILVLTDEGIVSELRERSCSDPRDRIYGVLSLFRDPYKDMVDYKLSVAEVFADFTMHALLILRGNISCADVSVFNYERQAMGTNCQTRSDLPSWCPDWTVASSSDCTRFHGGRASGGKNFWHRRLSKTKLAIQGVVVSELKIYSDSVFGLLDCDYSHEDRLIWLEGGGTLCKFFEAQGLEIGPGLKEPVLTIFEHVLFQGNAERVNGQFEELSEDMRLFFEQFDITTLVREVLIPTYLASVDPELFKAAEFSIPEHLPTDEYDTVENIVTQSLGWVTDQTRLFVTQHGMTGTGYPGIREGDLVCILYGLPAPQIIRQASDDGHYILVGACYMHGVMHGEALAMCLAEQDFIFV